MNTLVNRLVFFSLALALFAVMPVYAGGNITVANGTVSSNASVAGDFWNTGLNPMLNLSFNATGNGEVNVTSILINMTGSLNTTNITGMFVFNDTDADAALDLGEPLLGSNTTLNSTFNYTVISFSTILNIPANTKRNVLVAVNISRSALRFNTTGIMITINSSIRTNNSDSLDQITISTGSINSTVKQVLDMRANATLSPRVVDTNVSQQMFVYTISPSGQEKINRTKIVVPVGYTLVDVTDVYIGSTLQNRSFDGSVGVNQVGIVLGTTEFNVTTNTGGTSSVIKINFTVNTNLTAQSSAAFASKIFSNISFIDPDLITDTDTNVTTTQIIQIVSLGGNKTAAVMNGTDYWQFTFNINISVNVSGLIQFRMSNWSSSGGTINLTNQTPPSTNNTQFFASLFMSNDTGRVTNVTDNYNVTSGIVFNSTADTANGVKHLVLKMFIPSYAPVTSGWYSVYSMLFRSNPT